MIIKSLELADFRNYETLNISFDEGSIWKSVLTRVRIFFTEIMPRAKRTFWKQSMFLLRQNHIREVRIKRSLTLIKKRLISVPILKKMVWNSVWICIFVRISQRE